MLKKYAGISAAQGKDIEDIARDAAVSYVAGQVGGEVGGAVAGETGSQLAGNLAQGGTSGATSAVLSGRDPVTGLRVLALVEHLTLYKYKP